MYLNYRLLNFLLLIFIWQLIATPSFGQRKSTLSEEAYKQEANKLGDLYEDNDVAIYSASETIQFQYSTKSDDLIATEIQAYDYLGLKENGQGAFVRFYDETSTVGAVELFNHKGKKTYVQVVDEYYNNDDYFYSDARVKLASIKLNKGEKVHLYNEKKYSDVKYLTKAYFASNIPIVEKELKFVVPTDVEVELKEYNFEGYNIKKSKTEDVKTKATIYTYKVKDLAPVKTERNSPGPSHVLPHILILPKSYKKDNGQKEIIFKETKDLYKWYRGLVKTMSNDPAILKKEVEGLVNGLTNDLDKIKRIYYWVQDNIRYIAFEDGIAGFKPDDCQNVYEKKFGDCKGMANLLKEMLILAGFDARLTWIGTNRIRYDYSTPSLAVDNHMICTLIFNGKKYFLDPTEKYNPFAEYASRIQGKQALVEDGEEFILEHVPVLSHELNTEVVERNLKIEGEELVGTGRHTYNGEALSSILYSINNIKSDRKEDAIKRSIDNYDKNLLIENINYSDENNRDEQFELSYDLRLKNMITGFGEEYYLDLDYYKEFNQAIFKDRKSDYVFAYKYDLLTKVTIEIPADLKVSVLPKGYEEDNDFFTLKVAVEEKGGKIIYEKSAEFKQVRLAMDQFDLWNAAIEKLSAFYQEQVVLVKK